jgi:hypothetical protein
MEDIILKLSNVETMTDANEATRCEFISSILHASIAIAKKLTSQDIFIVLQKDISGEDATGRVDYAIKSLEDLLCITEGKPRNIKIGYAQVGLLSTFSLDCIANDINDGLFLRIWRNLKVRSKQIRKNELRIKHSGTTISTISMVL